MEFLFYGVFVRFSTRGVQKHQNLFLENPCQKLFAKKKLRKIPLFPVVFPFDFFNRVFGLSLHEELKNTIKICLKSDPKILKNLNKR
jgi:hypothetical protein